MRLPAHPGEVSSSWATPTPITREGGDARLFNGGDDDGPRIGVEIRYGRVSDDAAAEIAERGAEVGVPEAESDGEGGVTRE